MATQFTRAETGPLWAVVSGDDLPPHWCAVDTGLVIATARASVEIDDDVEVSAGKAVDVFPAWESGIGVAEGEYRTYSGELYSCIQPHTTQVDWTPDVVPALWHHWPKVAAGEDYPPWVQPTGAHDAYALGARVTHNGQNWESLYAANVWEPGVFGWEVVP